MQRKGIIAGRFELESLVGSGPFSAIYRARDLTSGAWVALKIAPSGVLADRFARETKLLAELQHPAVVRYIDHGSIGWSDLYLAMEWLEGEDLSQRLRRAELTVTETLLLTARVASALAAAHARGIVHRDIKPANLFLPGGEAAEVKLLDFGVAALRGAGREITLDGAMVGTPGYMAPEQARGSESIDARADVFALGCVMYRCLSGRPPFPGDDVIAILAKLVFEEPPRLREIRPEIPESLDDLVARMMSKAPEGRPEGGAAIQEALSRIRPALTAVTPSRPPAESIVEISDVQSIPSGPAITEAEQRLRSVVVTAAPGAPGESSAVHVRIRDVARAFGAELEPIAGGVLVATLSARGEPTDQAMQAARCALAMRAALPGWEMALATGRSLTSGRAPFGEVIDRAALLLRRAMSAREATASAPAPSARSAPPLRLDESTAGLLRNHFAIGGDTISLFVLRERAPHEPAPRTLLGRPAPCVGREPELALLEDTYHRCATGPLARAVVVTAPSGIGKSRLRHEFLRRLSAHGNPPEIWVGRGDPMAVGSPFRMLGQAVRQGIGLLDSDPLLVRQRKLRARLSIHLSGEELDHTAIFLGELLGAPFSSDQSAELRAARQDSMHMSDRMRCAWEDFLAAECTRRPLLIVLDDLQWGDLPTVQWIASALRNLRDKPLMVLALARPEAEGLFPDLFAETDRLEIRLPPLSPEASEALVRNVLSDKLRAEVRDELVERAAGNAFYLEEMIRAVAEGRGSALPDTVLAMVESRLSRLDADARRTLRAASVFGQVFWKGGVEALLGDGLGSRELREVLTELTAAEIVTLRREARFFDEEEYIFRQSLVRDAAYAMLTEADRVLGHRLAAAWLHAVGETDAVVLGEQFERGGEPSQAVAWYLRAAEQALEGNDFAAAIARAQRGIACGASGEIEGALHLVQAEAHKWTGNNADAAACGGTAMAFLARGSPRWLSAADTLATASAKTGNRKRLIEIAKDIGACEPGRPPEPYIIAAARIAIQILRAGHVQAADALLGIAQAVAIRSASTDPAAMACLYQGRGMRALFNGDPGAFMALVQAAADSFARVGDLRNAATQRTNVAYAYIEFGAYAAAVQALNEALPVVTRMGMKDLSAVIRHNLGIALAYLGALDDARAEEIAAVRASVAQGNKRLESGARTYLATILWLAQDYEGAEREARAAVQILAVAPPMRAHALGTLGRALLAQGRAAEALTATEEAMALVESSRGVEEGESLVRLSHIEALIATGRTEAVVPAVKLAHGRLWARAAQITDAAWRESFLKAVPDHARILEMARAWLGIT